MDDPLRKITCPVCKDGEGIYIAGYTKNGIRSSLHECRKCHVQFFLPFLNPGSHWYEKMSDYSLKDIVKLKVNRGAQKAFLKKGDIFKKGSLLLELGCGSGEFIAETQKRGLETYGVDFDQKGIEVAKRHFHLKEVMAMPFDVFFSKTDLPQFDYIVFFEVIEHIDNPLEFIQNVKKLLKPEGRVFLSTPSRERMLVDWNSWDFPPHHLTRWNKQAIENIFSKAGFKVVDVQYVEQFRMTLGAIDGKCRSGAVAKAANVVTDEKQSRSKAKILYRLAKVKMYVVGIIPATLLWFMGKLTDRNNGDMFIEVKIA